MNPGWIYYRGGMIMPSVADRDVASVTFVFVFQIDAFQVNARRFAIASVICAGVSFAGSSTRRGYRCVRGNQRRNDKLT